MGSSAQINSIAINLTDANNEVGMAEGDGISIRGFIAKFRDIYPKEFWPYSEESASLLDQQRDSLPPSFVSKFRWWPPWSSPRNIDGDGTNDPGLPSNSTRIVGSQMTSPTAIDQENERNTDIAGNAVVVNENVNCERPQNDDQRENAVVENEDINCERSHQDDQTGNAAVVNEDVNCQRSQQDDQTGNADVVNEDVNCQRSQQEDQTGNAVVENEDVNRERSQNDDQRGKAVVENENVNCEIPQKDDQRVTRSSKKAHHPPLKTYSLRNKSKKLAVENKRAEKPNVEQLAVTEIAACVEDTQPKASESIGLFIGEAPCWKTRKSRRTRRLADLNDKPVINTREEETSSQKEALRGKKRKAPPGSSKVSTAGAVLETASKSVEAEHSGSEPTDSGFDDELVHENHADPSPPMAKRTMKVRKCKKGRTKTAVDSSKNASSSVQPSLNEKETVPSPPREERTEERVGNSLDDQLASDEYVRKPNPQVNERQENNGVRSREVVASYVPVFGNPSIPNTGRGLGTGPGAIYFGSSNNNNNNNQRSTTTSTVVAAQSPVPHKDASVPDRKGKGVMVQSHDETENTQNDNLPDKEADTNNTLPLEPQKPKTPFLFDLNEPYEDDTSLEDNTNAAREEERVPVRSEQNNTNAAREESEQNSVEPLPPRQTYMPSPSVIRPHAQESRRSSILFPGHNPQLLGNVSMATHHHHYHHPSPCPYQVMHAPHQYSTPSPPVWASSMIPPQYHHHHLSPAPFNMDYSSMHAQAPRSDTWNLSYYGMNQAMMSRMDPRFTSNTPVDHHGSIVFTPPRHVHPVNQFNPPVNQFNPPINQFNPPINQFNPPDNQFNHPVNQFNPQDNQLNRLVELQSTHERLVLPRIRNQGRFQRPLNSLTAQRRNEASSSNNASSSPADNSLDTSECIASMNPAEISDIEPGNVYMVPEEALHVAERMAEFEQAEKQLVLVAESG